MPYLIGTDEAGYAPRLGPLVISASVFWVDDRGDGDDLYRRLKHIVCRKPARGAVQRRLAIADSKAIYSTAGGLQWLERGVLAMLSLLGSCPQDWLDIWRILDAQSLDRLPAQPWHANCTLTLPVAADADELERFVSTLRRGMDRAGVRLLALASRAIFPAEFNSANDRWGNKSQTLSKHTLALLAEMLGHCTGQSVQVVCDKHGGRNAYGRLLQEQFPESLVEIYGESTAESVYRWGSDPERIDVRFRAGGESFLPAALASMTSKYLRELSMRLFNEYWCQRVENLAPTAGYPADAVRFRDAVRDTQQALGIADHVMWRSR